MIASEKSVPFQIRGFPALNVFYRFSFWGSAIEHSTICDSRINLKCIILYFSMFFLGIQVDFETPEPEEPTEEVQEGFDEIQNETLAFLRKWLDPNAPLQETYPAPTKEFNGKT